MGQQTTLKGSPLAIDIAPGGYTLRAPDSLGTVKELEPPGSATRGPAGYFEDRFQEALLATDIVDLKDFEIDITTDASPGGPAGGLRSAGATASLRDGEPAITLTVPRLREGLEYAVIHTDEAGVSRWFWPEQPHGQADTTAPVGDGEVVFHLPRAGAPPGDVGQEPTSRGPISKIGRRLVRILVWATDDLVGHAATTLAARWETSRRPYAFRGLPLASDSAPISWDSLRQGRALLLLHGTFSLARSAFSQIPAPLFDSLARTYGGRIFAFDHPTLHHSPRENVDMFLRMLPEGAALELDLLTHSRGGLVGREIIERQADHAALGRTIRVRRAVFVGAPNLGTILTDGDHGIDLLDRYTNLLTDLPDDAFTLTIEGVFALAKLLAHGALHGLPGLRCMLPDGDDLHRINSSPDHRTEYYAVAADYAPSGPALFARVASAAAAQLMDSVFGEPSDGVVPTRGCYECSPGAASFPISPSRRLILDGDEQVHHCNYFGNARLQAAIIDWLKA